jgi:hypothetical protein
LSGSLRKEQFKRRFYKTYWEELSMNSRPTQCDKVIRYLTDFGSITQLEALQDLGIMRLASRISELNKSGYNIKAEMVKGTNRWGESVKWARYSFEQKEGQLKWM